MKRSIKTMLVALVVSLSLAAPGLAGPYEDGKAAFDRGDYATAIRLLRPLAEQGDAAAQYSIGHMYFNGRGVPPDVAAAASWYRKAAGQGEPKAQNAIGFMYIMGIGVGRNYVQAHRWLSLAASQGDKGAATSRNRIASKMTPAQIAETQRLAREWKPKK